LSAENELEDLYLPYRPKRRTRATIAREKAWNRWQSSLSGTVGATLMSLDEEAASISPRRRQ